MEDIFTLQDEITLVLATEMQVKLTEGEQARLHYTTTSNVEAWTFWVQGLYHFRKAVMRDSTAAALACWQKALALDPDSSALNAMVGFIHYIDARFGWWDDFQTATGKALLFAGRALELDPESPDAHLTHGFAMLLHGNYAEAASHAHRAAALAPSSADVASFACFCLAFAGYPLEAVVLGERSLTLSPFSPPFYFGHLGNAYRLASQFEPAIACFRTYHQRIAGFGLVDLVLAFHETGRIEEARSAARELLAIRRDFTIAGWARTQFRADMARFETDRAALAACGLPSG
jgi:adenylate cyclase